MSDKNKLDQTYVPYQGGYTIEELENGEVK